MTLLGRRIDGCLWVGVGALFEDQHAENALRHGGMRFT